MSNNNEWEWIKPDCNDSGLEWVLVKGQEQGGAEVRARVVWEIEEYEDHGMWSVSFRDGAKFLSMGRVEGLSFASALGLAEAAAWAPRKQAQRPVIETWRPKVVMPEVAK